MEAVFPLETEGNQQSLPKSRYQTGNEAYQLNLVETRDVRANKSNSMRAYPEDPKVTGKISSCDKHFGCSTDEHTISNWLCQIPSPQLLGQCLVLGLLIELGYL
jgi:hypothetical protein